MMSHKHHLPKPKTVADHIVAQLKELGFTIQRLEAVTSDSVYLKLDYGVCNSIRVSDHKGLKHLDYMFNVHIGRKGPWSYHQNRYTRYYYSGKNKQVQKMIEHIQKHRIKKLTKYGRAGYIEVMESNRLAHESDRKGFWATAEPVHIGYVPEIDPTIEHMNEGVLEW